jgi:peptidoglycan/LPS O-acetylase OafA/YrhL
MGSLQHTWSLAVEEQYYLIWPAMLLILIRLCGRDKNLLAKVILGLAGGFVALRFVLGSGPSPLALYPSTLVRMDALLVGCACACLYEKTTPFWSGRLGGLVSGACGVALIALTLTYNSLRFSGTAGLVRTLVALYTAAIILRLTSGVGNRVLEHSWLVAIGKRSYGIYLYPVVVGYAFPNLAFPGRALVISLVGIAVAWVSFKYLESPFLRQSSSSMDYQGKIALAEKPPTRSPALVPS